MSDRDVLTEAREKVRYLDKARAYGLIPLEGELQGLIADLADEIERLRFDVDLTLYRASGLHARLSDAHAALVRVRAVHDAYRHEPGNSPMFPLWRDLGRALDGTPRRCAMAGEEWHDAPTCRDCRALDGEDGTR